MRDLPALAESLLPIVARAGAAIMRVYDANFAVQRKEDNSPLTLADLESQRVILEGLAAVTPEIPVLSEESAQAPWTERQNWSELWVVDPLDGTREFVKRNGEFTINIALVQAHEPVLGLVAAPALGLVYWGAAGVGAFSHHRGAARLPIHVDRKSVV
jgi:3'(2'), 5'-bisphosphate nucleotidase